MSYIQPLSLGLAFAYQDAPPSRDDTSNCIGEWLADQDLRRRHSRVGLERGLLWEHRILHIRLIHLPPQSATN